MPSCDRHWCEMHEPPYSPKVAYVCHICVLEDAIDEFLERIARLEEEICRLKSRDVPEK